MFLNNVYAVGLRHDDCLYETDDVTEALRRLPDKEIDERNYRIIRAFQLSMQKIILPRDQWTKYEEVGNLLYSKNRNSKVKRRFYSNSKISLDLILSRYRMFP